MAGRPRWPYWLRFAMLAGGSLGLLLAFVMAFLPQRFLLELDFNESGFSFPVVHPPVPGPPPAEIARRPTPRGPGERLWSRYLPLAVAGEDSAAAALLSTYTRRYPGDAGALAEYARVLWRLGRHATADATYRRAIAAGAGPDALKELARLRAAASRWDEALDLYERLLERAPRDLDLRLEWARVLYWSGQSRRAAEVLAGLPPTLPGVDALFAKLAVPLPLEPKPAVDLTAAETPLDYARRLARDGALDSALSIYRSRLREQPERDSLLLEMADLEQFRANRPDAALVHLRDYLDRHPVEQSIRLRIAHLLAWSGHDAEARATLDTVVRAAPELAGAWLLLGDLYRWRGDRDRAAAAYRRALALDPESEQARRSLRALEAEIETLLAARGTHGPATGVERFADSDGFRLLRWSGGWTVGSPRTRGAFRLAVEDLSGRGAAGQADELSGLAARTTLEHWWLQGELRAAAGVGLWITEDPAAAEPLVDLSLAAPDWRGGSYELEYRHGPAHPETRTLASAAADLRIDQLSLAHYRRLRGPWDLRLTGRLARIDGAGSANIRSDAGLGVFLHPGSAWTVGYETRWLGFDEAAPTGPQTPRLYWDPRSFWTHSAIVSWTSQIDREWGIAWQVAPGIAWVDERSGGSGSAAAFVLSSDLSVERRWGEWALAGRAALSQSRAGAYRALRLQLDLSRGFPRSQP